MKTDKELIVKFITGDNDSVGILYSKYYKLFINTSGKFLCNKEDAEDLIHNLISKLLTMSVDRRERLFSNIDSLSAFFYTMTKNACLDFLRKKKIEISEIDIATIQIEETYNKRDNIELDFKKVGLSKTETICFDLYITGKKPKEISMELNKNISTVKNTLDNGKKKVINYYRKQIHLSGE